MKCELFSSKNKERWLWPLLLLLLDHLSPHLIVDFCCHICPSPLNDKFSKGRYDVLSIVVALVPRKGLDTEELLPEQLLSGRKCD